MTRTPSMPIEILQNKDISVYSKLIFLSINSFKPESCYMKINDFMEELGFSRPTVDKSIKELKQKKLVIETQFHGLTTVTNQEKAEPAEAN